MTLNANTVARYIADNSGTGTFLLKDSGSGEYIHTWSVNIAEPTSGQLATIATTLADEKSAAIERVWRDAELLATDYTQLADADLTVGEVSDFATYRQELRDMPGLSGFPNSHTRPTAPA